VFIAAVLLPRALYERLDQKSGDDQVLKSAALQHFKIMSNCLILWL
jgi:hypothetical protein